MMVRRKLAPKGARERLFAWMYPQGQFMDDERIGNLCKVPIAITLLAITALLVTPLIKFIPWYSMPGVLPAVAAIITLCVAAPGIMLALAAVTDSCSTLIRTRRTQYGSPVGIIYPVPWLEVFYHSLVARALMPLEERLIAVFPDLRGLRDQIITERKREDRYRYLFEWTCDPDVQQLISRSLRDDPVVALCLDEDTDQRSPALAEAMQKFRSREHMAKLFHVPILSLKDLVTCLAIQRATQGQYDPFEYVVDDYRGGIDWRLKYWMITMEYRPRPFTQKDLESFMKRFACWLGTQLFVNLLERTMDVKAAEVLGRDYGHLMIFAAAAGVDVTRGNLDVSAAYYLEQFQRTVAEYGDILERTRTALGPKFTALHELNSWVTPLSGYANSTWFMGRLTSSSDGNKAAARAMHAPWRIPALEQKAADGDVSALDTLFGLGAGAKIAPLIETDRKRAAEKAAVA